MAAMWDDTNINCGERKILNFYPRAKAHSKSVVKPGCTTSLRHFQPVELSSEKEKRKTVCGANSFPFP